MGNRASLFRPDMKWQTALLQVCTQRVVDSVLNRACLAFSVVKAVVYESASFQGTAVWSPFMSLAPLVLSCPGPLQNFEVTALTY